MLTPFYENLIITFFHLNTDIIIHLPTLEPGVVKVLVLGDVVTVVERPVALKILEKRVGLKLEKFSECC